MRTSRQSEFVLVASLMTSIVERERCWRRKELSYKRVR